MFQRFGVTLISGNFKANPDLFTTHKQLKRPESYLKFMNIDRFECFINRNSKYVQSFFRVFSSSKCSYSQSKIVEISCTIGGTKTFVLNSQAILLSQAVCTILFSSKIYYLIFHLFLTSHDGHLQNVSIIGQHLR